MASSSDGVPILPSMPDFSSHHSLFSSAGDMKFHLQTLLDNKEKQLQQAATLGQRVLAQQMELDERIRQLQEPEGEKSDDDQVDESARERYRELADALVAWDKENAQLSSAFGSFKRFPNGKTPSPSITFAELPREEPERSRPSAGTSAAQSRRAKNAAHRADDVEFAFEIGSGLLTEVRRLQSLLGERDKAIQDMKEEKDDLEKSVESLRAAVRQQEQSADKYKEENWNLEVTLQELRTQLSDSQSATQRLESEHKRITKLLSTSRDAGDQHKNESERLTNVVEEMKAKHETDIAQARRHAAGLVRDKSDLQQTIDTLKKEAARADRRFPRFGSPLTPNGAGSDFVSTPAVSEDGTLDVFTGGASTNRRKHDPNAVFGAPEDFADYLDSPEASPVGKPFLAPNHPNNEIEALQQRLAHAQRQINTLKGTLQREKQLKIDYRNRLEASPGASPLPLEEEELEEADGDDDDMMMEGSQKGKPRTITPFKVGGRGRGRGRGGRSGMTLIQRLAAASPSSVYNGDDARPLDDSSPPPVPPIPIHFSQPDDEEDLFSSDNDEQDRSMQDDDDRRRGSIMLQVQQSPSPLEPPSNRTSVDGMDPAFANVLRRIPSNGSSYAGSPLRRSVLHHSVRGRSSAGRRPRGGVPYKEARPPSLVDVPDVLSAELLGMDSSPLRNAELLGEIEETTDRPREVETAEFGCQSEIEEEAKAVVEPRVTVDMGVQSEPEPAPVPQVPVVVTAEQSMQTDEEPVAPQPFVPAHVEMSIGTDPEPEPEPIPTPVLMQAQTQTVQTEKADAVAQTTPVHSDLQGLGVGEVRQRRTTITQRDNSSFGSSSGDGTIIMRRRSFFAEPQTEEEEDEDEDEGGNETETGAETETDVEDYHDARQSIGMNTPSGTESRDDFHSIMTMTDNDLSETDDDEDDKSVKASSRIALSRHENSSVASSIGDAKPRPSSFYSGIAAPPVEYEEVGVSANFTPEPERIIERVVEHVVERVEVPAPLPPKPEVKEMSIQTDEWKMPPPPIVAPPASAPAQNLSHPAALTPGLYRVGSTSNHQFQFIAPPAPATTSSNISLSLSAAATPPAAPGPLSNLLRESGGTFPRSRPSSTDRRQSMESIISSIVDELPNRSRVPSAATMLSPVDKTKPPMMIVPPPPKAPPPPSSMAPPLFIPERRIPTSSTGSYEIPPPRPSSPPPAELIQRATTPTFGAALSVPGQKGVYNYRPGGSSMPPSQVRQPPSTSSFRSAANAAAYAQHAVPNALPSLSVRERRDFSQTSLVSERSVASPRSSMSSDHQVYRSQPLPDPVTPNKSADTTARPMNATSTDPAVIHAITQTMIGEFMYKYTRKTIGKGHGERRHKRFFWVHPYTKTLYWSSADPGSTNVSESSAKSAYIEGVRSVLDPNPMPPGLYQYSVVVSTPQREMKITAPTKERHDIWLNALKYLLARPNAMSITSPNNQVLQSPASQEFTDDEHRGPMAIGTPQSQRSGRSRQLTDTWNSTPRGQRSRSQLSMRPSIKRSGTPAAEYLRWNGPESPYSPEKSFVDVGAQDNEELDFELHGETMSDDGYEGLENVRACCDGRHTVGHSDKHHHHHHHHHNGDQQHLEPTTRDHIPTRPISPSAWSFRSRAGSSQSHDSPGNSLFSWGRAEGKLRFGSRRSARTVPSQDQ